MNYKNKNKTASNQGVLFDEGFKKTHTLKPLGTRTLTIYGIGIREAACEVFEVLDNVLGNKQIAVYDGMVYPYYYIMEIIYERKNYYTNQERRNGFEYEKWTRAYESGIGKYSWKYMVQYNISILCAMRSELDFVQKNKQNMVVRKIMDNQRINFFAVDYRTKTELYESEDIYYWNIIAKYRGWPIIENWSDLIMELRDEPEKMKIYKGPTT